MLDGSAVSSLERFIDYEKYFTALMKTLNVWIELKVGSYRQLNLHLIILFLIPHNSSCHTVTQPSLVSEKCLMSPVTFGYVHYLKPNQRQCVCVKETNLMCHHTLTLTLYSKLRHNLTMSFWSKEKWFLGLSPPNYWNTTPSNISDLFYHPQHGDGTVNPSSGNYGLTYIQNSMAQILLRNTNRESQGLQQNKH